MTPKQEAFCKAYLETGNASEAYRRAFGAGKMSPKTINEKASRLLSQDKIRTRVQELKEKLTDKWIWERKDSLRVLSTIADMDKEAATSRISAVKELNSMHGYNAPVKNQNIFTDMDGQPLNVIIKTIYVKPEPRT
ncbi:MAG: terminase small subunit [Desulfoprunum sp.]|nr:terminase small subunit [Desulfoprunum sp.]